MRIRSPEGEIAPAAWLGGAVSAVTLGGVVLLAERWVGTTPAFIVFWCGCAVAALCLFGAGRQHYINVGRDRERERVLPVQTPPALAAPSSTPAQIPSPVIEFITCEANTTVANYAKQYFRPPAEGEYAYAVVAAFRHREGPAASVTAHMRFRAPNAEGPVLHHIHGAAWLGRSGGSITLKRAETAEVVLALCNRFGFYYGLDAGIASSGITHKLLKSGRYVVELDLSVAPPMNPPLPTFVFDINLTKDREAMTVTLRNA